MLEIGAVSSADGESDNPPRPAVPYDIPQDINAVLGVVAVGATQPARDDPITSLETVQGVALRPDRLTPRDDRCVQAHGPS